MASGDKLLDETPADCRKVEQGTQLFSPNLSGGGYQGVFVFYGTVGSTVFQTTVQADGYSESAIPDFDVEKQYKLTIEEV